jgi:hypothetical protein
MRTLPISNAAPEQPRYVYVLLDQKFNVRYVGQSANPAQRVALHWSNRNIPSKAKYSTPIFTWLRGLEMRPAWAIIQAVPAEEIDAAEERWIDFFREIHGPELLNSTPGEWINGEWRAKVSAGLKGHPVSAGTRQKISDVLRGRDLLSPEARERQRQSMTGYVFSDERNRKISESLKGREHPWAKGVRRPAEVVEKTAAAHRGMKRSPETREKIRVAARHRYHSAPEPGCPRCPDASESTPTAEGLQSAAD